MSNKKISLYDTAVPVTTDYVLGNQASGPTTKRNLYSDIITLIFNNTPTATVQGWIAETGTWTYASGTGTNVGTFTISGDYTGIYNVGDKGKFTQTTVKYFIITKVAVSGDTTTVTIYMGTDYTIANAAITSPYYSHVKSPVGFPMDPAKWTITVTNTNQCAKTSPTANTWYGDTGLTSTGPNISLPIGSWRVSYNGLFEALKSATTTVNVKATLSTSSSTESDATFTSRADWIGASGNQDNLAMFYKEMYITTTSTTTYYLNITTTVSTTGSIAIDGNLTTTVIRAVCNYL